jgi:hypothetical protein
MKESEETKFIYNIFISNVNILSKSWNEELITIKNFIINEVDKQNILLPHELYTKSNKLCIELIEREWEYITKKTALENYEKEKQELKIFLNK